MRNCPNSPMSSELAESHSSISINTFMGWKQEPLAIENLHNSQCGQPSWPRNHSTDPKCGGNNQEGYNNDMCYQYLHINLISLKYYVVRLGLNVQTCDTQSYGIFMAGVQPIKDYIFQINPMHMPRIHNINTIGWHIYALIKLGLHKCDSAICGSKLCNSYKWNVYIWTNSKNTKKIGKTFKWSNIQHYCK